VLGILEMGFWNYFLISALGVAVLQTGTTGTQLSGLL
jgi:hypothetical protein